MKKIIAALFFISAMCGFAFAQSQLPELDKVKKIRLLESTREDIKKIFAGYEHDDSEDEDDTQYFSTKNAEIEVTFSGGDCSDNSEYWNVPKWTASKIKVTPENTIKIKDFKFNFSSFKKEIEDKEYSEDYIYHNENSGIVFQIEEGEIVKIIVFPQKNKIGFLCDNENSSEIFSNAKRVVDAVLENEKFICALAFANVTQLKLDKTEIVNECGDDSAKNKRCSSDDKKITVTTTAVDPENDVLLYVYTVSAGKIIGEGSKVMWDLSSVKPGVYTITAGVNDGCGVCGETRTESVTVKECSDCLIK